MNYKSLFGVTVVLGLSVFVNAAHAISCTTPSGAVTSDFGTDNVTFRGSASDACAGLFSGNDSNSTMFNAFGGGGTWYQLAKDNNPGAGGADSGNLFDDFGLDAGFTLEESTSGGGAAQSGTFTLSWSGADLPVQMDMAIVLKAGNGWAGYKFDDELFNATSTSDAGTWEIEFLNNGGQIPNISHFSLYVSNATTPSIVVPPTGISEPGTTALLGLGLLGFLVARRRLV